MRYSNVISLHSTLPDSFMEPTGSCFNGFSNFVCACLQRECRYEQELLPYFHKEDTEKNERKKQKASKLCTKTPTRKPKPAHTSWSELECIDEEMERNDASVAKLISSLVIPKQRHPVETDSEVTCDEATEYLEPEGDSSNCEKNDHAITNKTEYTFTDHVSLNSASQENDKSEEDFELQAMFHLPEWNSGPAFHSDKPRKDKSLAVILANVAELLSRSPPSLVDILEEDKVGQFFPPPPQTTQQPFLVSFSLDVDDDEENEVDADNVPLVPYLDEPSGSKTGRKNELLVRAAVDSPTWDEVFEAEEVTYDVNRETEFKKQNDSEEKHVMKSKNNGTVKERGEWDEMRDELTLNVTDNCVKDEGAITEHLQMDESMDLFEDDEAFLQMTIPDIPTPEDSFTPRISLDAGNDCKTENGFGVYSSPKPSHLSDGTQIINPVQKTELGGTECRTQTELKTKLHTQSKLVKNNLEESAPRLNASSVQEKPGPKDSYHDVFPVNFDLGYSLEDSEDEMENDVLPSSSPPTKPDPSVVFLPPILKSSTPTNCFSRQFNQSKVSSSHMPTKCGMSKREELPSPITSPGPRRTPGFPGPMSIGLKQTEGTVPTSTIGKNSRQESVHAINSPPHPGLSRNNFLE